MKTKFVGLIGIPVVFLVGCAQMGMSPQAEPAVKSEPSVQVASDATIEPGKGVLIQESAKITAVVMSVDKADRSIMVKGPEGNVKSVELTDDVKNFDQIHPGDEVVLEVYTALAMQLAKPGQEFEDVAKNVVAVAKPGEKPKAVNVDVVDVLAEISAINKEKREVTVTGPMGRSVTLVVPPDIEKFDELKIGEKVNARYVEAFAMSVEAPEAR